ncbi:unnamed protein product [Effrenium voratum]|nr:unnamed protein product [Effrenium voratum]
MACIGPYSQAQRVQRLLLSSGVLGLVPHTMSLPSAEAVQASKSEPDATSQVQAELWMLMRSLHHVLQVMSSGFHEVALAQVYATPGVDAVELCREILAYMRFSAPSAMPLVSYAEVPRLPKGGCVEIAVLCSAEPSSKGSREIGEGVCVKIAEADACDLSAALACVRSLAEGGGCLDALQVQFCPPELGIEVAQAVQAAMFAETKMQCAECAVSYMPVCSLRASARLRCIGFISTAQTDAAEQMEQGHCIGRTYANGCLCVCVCE